MFLKYTALEESQKMEIEQITRKSQRHHEDNKTLRDRNAVM
jgi:hypothetical protein